MLIFIPLVNAATLSELQERIRTKEKEIAQLESEADAYRKSIGETLALAKTLKGEIARVDSQLKQLNYNLNITQKQLEATELKIQEIGLDIEETNKAVVTSLKEIGETLQTISELDNETLLATLFKSDKLSDFFTQASYLESLQQSLRTRVGDLRSLKVRLEKDLGDSEKAKQKFKSLSSSLNNQKRITLDKRQERSQLLAETKNQEQNYQRLLAETVKRQEAIEREIFELESELRRQIISAELPPRNPGLFLLPVDNGYVTQEFGSTRRDGLTHYFYSFHNGMDFGSKTGVGTPVRAVAGGRVASTGNNGRYAYGKWVAIRHPNGLTTLYAHLSLVGVSTGTEVKQGDNIGYMGRTGLATGPHLHFTVYATNTFRIENRWFGALPIGGVVNPRDYLPKV